MCGCGNFLTASIALKHLWLFLKRNVPACDSFSKGMCCHTKKWLTHAFLSPYINFNVYSPCFIKMAAYFPFSSCSSRSSSSFIAVQPEATYLVLSSFTNSWNQGVWHIASPNQNWKLPGDAAVTSATVVIWFLYLNTLGGHGNLLFFAFFLLQLLKHFAVVLL